MNLFFKRGILHNMNNYHTHTWRCKHAEGTVSEYAQEAGNADIKILGMSDHTPLPDGRWNFVRMDLDELEPYLEEIKIAAEAVPEVTILKGLECDWADEYRNFYIEELLGKRDLDYLIGSVHWFPHHGEWLSLGEIDTVRRLSSYGRHIVKAMESGLFSFIAHPDAFGIGYGPWDDNARACSRDIVTAAKELGVILEINGYGLRKPEITTEEGTRRMYPLRGFWEKAGEAGITAICNSDAHRPEDVAASLDETGNIAKDFGVRTTEELPVRIKG